MGLDRRSFMKFMAGATAGIMATPLPWKLLDDVSIWTQNWGWIPRNTYGESAYMPAISKMCPSNSAVKVRLVKDRPIRVLPNPDHPLGGGITALAVAEAQMLNSPARVHAPLRRAPDGAYVQITWAEAGEILAEKIKSAKNKSAFICGDENGSTLDVITAFARQLQSNQVYLMPSEAQVAAKAAELAGIEAQLGYDIERSDYVLAIGANIFETWGPVIRNRKVLATAKPHPDGSATQTAHFTYAGPLQNQTACVARPWLPIHAGSELAFALSIAAELIKQGKSINAPDFAAFSSLAQKYAGTAGEKATGIAAKDIAAIAQNLLSAKTPTVIVASEGTGVAPVLAGFAINALLGRINLPGHMTLIHDEPQVIQGSTLRRQVFQNDVNAFFAKKILPQLLIVHEANPAYELPDAKAVQEVLTAIPYTVSFSTFMDETASLCDLVLPIPMGLERLDDIYSPYGLGHKLYCVTAPVIEPNPNYRSTGDVLLFIAQQLNMRMGFERYADVIKAKAEYFGEKADALAKGKVYQTREHPELDWGFRVRPDIIAKAVAYQYGPGLKLVLYNKLSLGTAKTGIPPFNTKTIRFNELSGKIMYVMMNGVTAKGRGIQENSLVTLKTTLGTTTAYVRIFEGLAHDCVAVCKGYGHTALDQFSQNKGCNIMELVKATSEPETGLFVYAKTNVEVSPKA